MMKFLIMGGLLLVVLGGGGVGAYIYFGKSAEAAATHGAEEAGGEAAKAEGNGHGEEAQVPSEFVKLDPLILPIVDRDGVSQVLNLVIAIEVPDKAAADEVTRLSPRLKDAYITELYGILNKEAAIHNGVVQVGAIKKKLAVITEKVLGKDKARDVLLQVVHQRPI
ncbi:MAG TPA: flagellar basal body-associated FliL family protein [Alphaproteobacteria bacterium]|nr:flagellar basal body-associated FliL family protein [Alphaproteobacteria bacterium]